MQFNFLIGGSNFKKANLKRRKQIYEFHFNLPKGRQLRGGRREDLSRNIVDSPLIVQFMRKAVYAQGSEVLYYTVLTTL